MAEFLLARIAEDEAVAQRNTGDRGVGDDGFFPDYRTYSDDDTAAADEYLHRFNPARVLAECEAKRRIVEDAINDVRDARRRPGWTIPDSEVDELGRRYRAGVEHQKAQQLPDTLDRTDRLLRLLALPYADHPDYRPEWKV